MTNQIKLIKRQLAPLLSIRAAFITFFLILSANSYAEETLYTVKAGDTLWDISKTWLNNAQDWKKLQSINNIKNPDMLIPNSQIRIPASLLKKKNKQAILKYFHGNITIKDKTGKNLTISLGMAIYEGDTLVTGAASTLRLEFLTGSKSSLQENSRLTIKKTDARQTDKNSHIQLYLHQGNISNSVKRKKEPKSRFIITTPSATASVRGTTFRVANNLLTQKFHTEVLEGTVDVTGQGQTVTVKEGFGVLVKTGEPPGSPAKLLDKADLSGLRKNFNQVPVFFRFEAVNNAVAYRVELSKGNTFNQQFFGKDINKPEIRFVKMENGTYLLRVFGYDKNGLAGKVAMHRFNVNLVKNTISSKTPKLVYPDDQLMIEEANFAFKWISSNAANGYHFQLASDKAFSQLKIDIFPYQYNTLSISDRLPSGNYYWHVATLDKNNKARYTDANSFRIAPPIPVLNEAKYIDGTIELGWHTTSGFMTSNTQYRYQLQVSASADFSTLLIDEVVEKNRYQHKTKKIDHYYIRVFSVEADNFVGIASSTQHLQLKKRGLWGRQLINISSETEPRNL